MGLPNNEPDGLTLLELMACGRIFLLHDIGVGDVGEVIFVLKVPSPQTKDLPPSHLYPTLCLEKMVLLNSSIN